MKRSVATLCLGDESAAIARLTRPFMEAYAAAVHADFVPIDRAKGIGPTPHFEKYQVREILDVYDRVLYLDADVLVVRRSPDLFALVPEDRFGAYLASEHSRDHDKAVAAIQAALGGLGWARDYFNSGVMLVGKRHRGVFDVAHGLSLSFYEQTQLNYNVRKLGVPLHDVAFRFNHVQAAGGDRLTSHIIHYAGPGHGTGPKVEQIARDIAALEARGPGAAGSRGDE